MTPWKEKRVIGNAELYLGDCLTMEDLWLVDAGNVTNVGSNSEVCLMEKNGVTSVMLTEDTALTDGHMAKMGNVLTIGHF